MTMSWKRCLHDAAEKKTIDSNDDRNNQELTIIGFVTIIERNNVMVFYRVSGKSTTGLYTLLE